jgi:hypothetical protein
MRTPMQVLRDLLCDDGEPASGSEEVDKEAPPTDSDLPTDDPDALEWPVAPAPAISADASARYAAQLEVRKKRVDAEIALTKARDDADLGDLKAWADANREIAKGSIQRARDGADAVLKGAAAIVTLYTGVLGLVFANNGTPLPARGILPALFLGLAVVLATAYLAFLRPSHESVDPTEADQDLLEVNVIQRANLLVLITRAITKRLAWSLRAAVVSLGVGLALLPLPFISAEQLPAVSITPASAPKPAATPKWPDSAGVGTGNRELAKILYQAQVDRAVAVAEREDEANVTAAAPANDADLVGWAAIAGLFVIALLTLISGPAASRGGRWLWHRLPGTR